MLLRRPLLGPVATPPSRSRIRTKSQHDRPITAEISGDRSCIALHLYLRGQTLCIDLPFVCPRAPVTVLLACFSFFFLAGCTWSVMMPWCWPTWPWLGPPARAKRFPIPSPPRPEPRRAGDPSPGHLSRSGRGLLVLVALHTWAPTDPDATDSLTPSLAFASFNQRRRRPPPARSLSLSHYSAGKRKEGKKRKRKGKKSRRARRASCWIQTTRRGEGRGGSRRWGRATSGVVGIRGRGEADGTTR